jgi:oxysterol-binding protein-related protein 3/6/7
MQRLLYVTAFAVSGYSATAHRPARKPFNPLLGETYDYEGPEGTPPT